MNIDNIVTILGTILGSSTLTLVIQHWLEKRKNRVDADSVTIDNILKWATSLMGRISDLEKQIESRNDEIQELYKKSNEDHCAKSGPDSK